MSNISSASAKGFLQSLFDFSFNSFVTTKLVKTLYIIVTVVYSFAALAIFVTMASRGALFAVVGLIIVPILFILYLGFARVTFELIMVVFHIAEDTRQIRNQMAGAQMGQQGPGGTGPVPTD